MSTLYVDNLQPNLGSRVMAAGHVVQVQTKKWASAGFSTTSSSPTAITDFYVDITPTSSNSIILFQSSITMVNATTSGYARFSIEDTNAASQWSSNTYMAAAGYNGSQWIDVPIIHSNTAGTTNTMRLQLRVLVGGTGTVDMGWSSSDHRTITAMEIAQ